MPPKGQHAQKQTRFDIPMHLTTLSSRDWVNRLIGTRGALHKELEASCGCTLKLCSDLAKTDPYDPKGRQCLLNVTELHFIIIGESNSKIKAATELLQQTVNAIVEEHYTTMEPPASRSTLDDARDQWPAVEARAATAQSSAAASRQTHARAVGTTPAEAHAAETAAHAAGEAEADLETCAVCMDAKASVRFRPCGHDACPECVVKLRRRTMSQVTAGTVCPLCRQVILEYVVPNGVYVGSQPAPPPAVGLARKVLPPRLEATPLAAPAARRGAPASRPERLDLPGDGMQSFVPTANFRTKLCPNWSQACKCFPRLFFVHGVLSVAARSWQGVAASCKYGIWCYFAHGEDAIHRGGPVNFAAAKAFSLAAQATSASGGALTPEYSSWLELRDKALRTPPAAALPAVVPGGSVQAGNWRNATVPPVGNAAAAGADRQSTQHVMDATAAAAAAGAEVLVEGETSEAAAALAEAAANADAEAAAAKAEAQAAKQQAEAAAAAASESAAMAAAIARAAAAAEVQRRNAEQAAPVAPPFAFSNAPPFAAPPPTMPLTFGQFGPSTSAPQFAAAHATPQGFFLPGVPHLDVPVVAASAPRSRPRYDPLGSASSAPPPPVAPLRRYQPPLGGGTAS